MRCPDNNNTVSMTTVAKGDRELAVEDEMPSLEEFIPPDVLCRLKKTERKRQAVINGIYIYKLYIYELCIYKLIYKAP